MSFLTNEVSQGIAHRVRQAQGIELTPDQVAERGQVILDEIRRRLEAKGCALPTDDQELSDLIQRAVDEHKGD